MAKQTTRKLKSINGKVDGKLPPQAIELEEAVLGALMLDNEGYVMEGTGENVFVIRNGTIFTPDLTSALEGITRDTVVTLINELGLELIEKRITRDEIYISDEAFFTGTAAEVTPIAELDGRLIGSGTRGPITAKIQARYFDCVQGREPNHIDWLTFI